MANEAQIDAARRCWDSDNRAVKAHRDSLRQAIENEDKSYAAFAEAKWGVRVGGKVMKNGQLFLVTNLQGWSRSADMPPVVTAVPIERGKPQELGTSLIGWTASQQPLTTT